MKKIKILLADDHQIVLDGLKTLINGIPEFEVVAAVNDGKSVLEKANQCKIDVALLDIDMPLMNGIDATFHLKKSHPEIKVIALSMHNEKGIIEKILEAGANGYMLKNADINELTDAIKTVYAGKQYLCSDASITLLKKQTNQINVSPAVYNAVALSTRELEIAKLVAKGLSSKQIGEKLFISPRTADTHRTNIMEKLGLKSIPELVHYCIKNDLLG